MDDEPISRMEWLNLQLAQRQRAAERSYAQEERCYRNPEDTAMFPSERERSERNQRIKLQAKGK
jgi:hypothetical protein